jgi:hypothetical protein
MGGESSTTHVNVNYGSLQKEVQQLFWAWYFHTKLEERNIASSSFMKYGVVGRLAYICLPVLSCDPSSSHPKQQDKRPTTVVDENCMKNLDQK